MKLLANTIAKKSKTGKALVNKTIMKKSYEILD